MLDGVEVVVPEQIEAIHSAYMQVVEGQGAKGRDILSQIARQLPVDAIVLAGTDLSPIFDESNTDFHYVDCVQAHIAAMLREMGSG